MRVLLVGSSSEMLREFADRLRSAGCPVQESGHAGDALHTLGNAVDAATPFEVVVVDAGLSGIDASLFADLVREDQRLASVPLVLLSGGSEGEFGRFAAAGYVGQVGIPVDAASLANLLNAVPASPAPPAAAVLDLETPCDGAAEAAPILLVEDNEINMEVAREMIETIGYRCDCVLDGYQAVEAATRRSYGLVLMDCQMPGLDGYEATRRIRTEEANNGGRRVPIVAVTAHAMKGDRERCLAAGMDDYMTKPVETGTLSAAIAKWLVTDRGRRR